MEEKKIDEALKKEIEESHDNPKSNPLKKRWFKHFVICGSIFIGVCAVAIPLIVHYVIKNFNIEDISNYNVSKGILYNINEYLHSKEETKYDKISNLTIEEKENTIIFKVFASDKKLTYSFFTITLANKPEGGIEKVIGQLRSDVYDSFKNATYDKNTSYTHVESYVKAPYFSDSNISLVKFNLFLDTSSNYYTCGFYKEKNKADTITSFNLAQTDSSTFIINKDTGIYNEAKKATDTSKTSYLYSYLNYLSNTK